jgi:sporulation protein YlmC with PRC-barrel domain
MMTTPNSGVLIKLSDSGQTVLEPSQDVRGRPVRTSDGSDLGHVDDLLIDPEERQVRMLRIKHGGLLGIGAEVSFVPVEVIAQVTADAVVLTGDRQAIHDAPRYDPELIELDDFYRSVYGYWGFPPFAGV